eukprot:g2696.t1
MAEVGIDDSAVVKFFDNDFLFSYFVKNYISANVLPILRKVCVKFNKICKCHWQEIFRKACEPYHWWYGGKNTSDWNGKLWERLYVITTIKNNLLCGTFGGSIESRQAPLKRVDIYGTSKSDADNENYVFDAIDPSVYTKKEMNTGRQAAASAYNWKLEEISTFVRPFLNRCGYYVAGGNLFDLNNLKPDHFNGFVREKELGLTIENVDP